MSTLWRAFRVLTSGMLPLAAACGGGGALQLGDVTPEAIPALEAAQAQRPGDVTSLTRLGVAYFRANRLPDARQALDTVVARDPSNAIAAIYQGMTAEEQGDFATARSGYQGAVTAARTDEVRSAARQRLALVGRRELEFQARQALASEGELAQAAPEPGTIAVMPFGYTGVNPDIQPLTRGFAQLLVTDLSKSPQVRVLERERMQAMLDEMRLGDEGRADPAAAARSGRLLRAQRVVQGSLADREEQLNVNAAVVDVTTADVSASASGSDRLARIFDLEKTLVFDIFNGLGIQLTDAERQAVSQRPTQNLQAFLAWSRGLEAEDRGDFNSARDFYNQAQRLDPGFTAATQGSAQVSDLQAATVTTVQDVDVAVAPSAQTEGGAGGVTEELRRDALATAANNVNPTTVAQLDRDRETQPTVPPRDRDTTPEATGTEGPRPVTGTVIIVIRRP